MLQIFNTLPDKSPEELIAIRDTFIKRDREEIKKIEKEIKQYSEEHREQRITQMAKYKEQRRIQMAEYKEQRKNLTVNSFANSLNYNNAKKLEKTFFSKVTGSVAKFKNEKQ